MTFARFLYSCKFRSHRVPYAVVASALILSFGGCTPSSHADPLAPPVEAAAALENKIPPGIFTEAEMSMGVAQEKIIGDSTASSGQIVTLKGDGDQFPLAVPAGTAFKVWVRRKYGPLTLKGTKGGKETELKQLFDAPTDWTWSDMGTYERSELGESIILMRKQQNEAPDVQVDAVVFAPDIVRPLPPFEPDALAAPITVKAEIDWDKMAGKMAPDVWGVNDYEILDPKKAADEGLQKFASDVEFPIIRIHEGGFCDRWTDSATRNWNVEKIKAGFAASTGYGDSKVMMNIANWPGWLQSGDYLPPDKVDEYVKLVGQLEVIMRDDVKHPITYWELPNEKEAEFEKQGKLDELWSLFNKLSAEIKKQDPAAKVGGPAMSWPNPGWVEGFLKNCVPNADFISWHNYASGSIYDSNELVFSKPADFAKNAVKMQELVAQYALGRQFETFLTEYNVKWTWTPYERRHENNVGAVFMASTMRQMGLSGISGVMLWHLKGNSYGMIDDTDKMRLPAYLYLWGIHYLTGDIAKTVVEDETQLEILPVVRADGAKSVLLINKANHTVMVPGAKALLPVKSAKKLWMARLDAKGFNAPAKVTAKGDVLSLPGYSVTILSDAPPLEQNF